MEPKFNIGQIVHVLHPNLGEWVGVVVSRALASDEWEYEVTNALRFWENGPRFLAWETEIEIVDTCDIPL